MDYLIKVRGLNFMEAAELMLDQMRIKPLSHVPMPEQEEVKEKKLLLPEPYRYQEYVTSYLRRRGIDEEIIEFCLKTGRIYESAYHHNAVFVGMDKDRVPRYAALRGIGTDFIGEASGSDKNYSFSVTAREESKEVHLFESAIDLLSYGTLRKQRNLEWRANYLLSLAGVYQPAKEIEQSKVPATLARFLKEHPEEDTIVFHLDNDRAGRMATRAISTVLRTNYEVTAIVKAEDGFRICSKDGRQILAKYLINCAGGYADKIAGLLDDKFAAPGEIPFQKKTSLRSWKSFEIRQ